MKTKKANTTTASTFLKHKDNVFQWIKQNSSGYFDVLLYGLLIAGIIINLLIIQL